jgi:acyl dehydratase
VHIDVLRPFVYDGCSRIYFPIHTSRKFAHDVGLSGIILQGTATLGFAVRELINKEAGADPRRLKALACRFAGMVLPGTEITVTLSAREEEGRGLFFTVSDSAGTAVIKDGYALLDAK